MGRSSTAKTDSTTTPSAAESAATQQKKLYWHTSYGCIEVTEQVFSQGKGKPLLRPFSQSASVCCRGYSSPLQRILTDLGADVPFGRIPAKLLEHYGITVPISSAQMITENHAAAIWQQQDIQTQIPQTLGVEKLIVQMDGSMIPIVETRLPTAEPEKLDRRKTRTVGWREARLCLARPHNCVKPIFGATLGTVDEAGDQLANSAIRAGVGFSTQIHGVGDGATKDCDSN